MIAVVRTTVITVAFLAGVPTSLVALGGNPLPGRSPSAAQLQTWLDDPLHPQYTPATAWVVAWLIWALLTEVKKQQDGTWKVDAFVLERSGTC